MYPTPEEEATRLLHEAVGGDRESQCYYGLRCEQGFGTPRNYEEAVFWYRRAADNAGYAPGQYSLGRMYLKGLGVPQDTAAALFWLGLAAAQNHLTAIPQIALIYEKGIGIARDYQQAVSWYRKCADLKIGMGFFRLGQLTRRGQGVPQSDAKAVECYTLAAFRDFPFGRYELLPDNDGNVEDDADTQAWIEAAADVGVPVAQFLLGHRYSHGEDVPKDEAISTTWYHKAANQNFAPAHYRLGKRYQRGVGFAATMGEPVSESDMYLAVSFYRKAAERGHAPAQRQLGTMYRDGIGVERDASESWQWLTKAAEQGWGNFP